MRAALLLGRLAIVVAEFRSPAALAPAGAAAAPAVLRAPADAAAAAALRLPAEAAADGAVGLRPCVNAARGQRWATGGEDGTIGLAGADLWLAVASDTTVIDPADASPRVVLSRNRSAALSFEFLPAGRGQRGPEVWIKTTGKPKGQPAGLCLNDDASAPRSKLPPKLPKGGIFLGGCGDMDGAETWVNAGVNASLSSSSADNLCLTADSPRPQIPAAAQGAAAAPPLPGTGVFSPVTFGADPTGVRDSTASLQRAVSAAFAWTAPDPTVGAKTTHNSVVDLQGGTYLINSTIWLGKGLTFRMCCGGLLAADSFPDGDFMISAGGALEGITIHDMQFDLNRRGSGALHFDNTLRVHLDRLFIHHYVLFGIQAVQGHEVHVSNCWLGEWAWAESGGRASQNLTGVAIEIDGQDHWLSDIIIFSGKQGIVLRGGALVLTNTHIYNARTLTPPPTPFPPAPRA